MVVEDHEMPNGWPLGLGNLNMRLRVTETLQPAAAAAAAAAAEPHSLHAPSSSFSSCSSSNLDTESTASFFQDHSVPLGRLMGIKTREGGALHCPNSNHFEQRESRSERISCPDVPRGHGEEVSRGICVPRLVSILVKLSRSKSNSRW